MGIIKSDDIIAYRINGKIICPKCFEKEYRKGAELTEAMIIKRPEFENSDDLLFCNIHGGQIK